MIIGSRSIYSSPGVTFKMSAGPPCWSQYVKLIGQMITNQLCAWTSTWSYNRLRPIPQMSHNASNKCPTMHHFVTEMCTFLLQNGALWDLGLMHCAISIRKWVCRTLPALFSVQVKWCVGTQRSELSSSSCFFTVVVLLSPFKTCHQSSMWHLWNYVQIAPESTTPSFSEARHREAIRMWKMRQGVRVATWSSGSSNATQPFVRFWLG